MKYPLPSNDPLGTDLQLDHNGDLIPTINGSLQAVKGADNVGQAVRMQMTTDAYNYLWGDEVGSTLAGYVDQPITEQSEREIKNIIIGILGKDSRIIKIQEVQIDDQTPGQLIVTPKAIVKGVGVVNIPVRIGGVPT